MSSQADFCVLYIDAAIPKGTKRTPLGPHLTLSAFFGPAVIPAWAPVTLHRHLQLKHSYHCKHHAKTGGCTCRRLRWSGSSCGSRDPTTTLSDAVLPLHGWGSCPTHQTRTSSEEDTSAVVVRSSGLLVQVSSLVCPRARTRLTVQKSTGPRGRPTSQIAPFFCGC